MDIINKYKITSFDNFDKDYYENNKDLLTFLKTLNISSCSNIILYGPSGSGKKTIIYSFLHMTKKIKKKQPIKINNREIDIYYYTFKNITEIDISEYGIYKTHIFKNFIKEIILIKNINKTKKIIIIHNIDTLSYSDQYILRKIIENYSQNVIFIMIANNTNNIMKPIISRAITLKTNIVNNKIIKNKLVKISNNENYDLKNETIEFIINKSKNSLKMAIILLSEFINYKEENVYKLHSSENKELTKLYNLIFQKKYDYISLETCLYNLLIIHKIKSTDLLLNIYKKYFNENINVLDLIFEYNKLLIDSKKDIIYLQDFVLKLRRLIM